MKTHSRRLSMALAVVMVLSLLVAFPALVSAADTNLANGLTPAVVGADGTTVVFGSGEDRTAHASGAQALTAVTDGDYGTAQSTSLELLGTNRVWDLTFTLAETSTLSSVVVYARNSHATDSDERAWNESAFAVTVDGATVAGAKTATSGLTYGYANTKYAYTFSAPVTGKTVKITASSTAYVLAIGEIEIMGSVGSGSGDSGSTDTPVVTPGVATNYVSGIDAKSVYSEYKGSNVVFGGENRSAHENGAQTTTVLTDGANATAQAEALELLGTACDWDVTFDMGAVKSDISSVVIYTRNSHATDSDERGWDSTKLAVQVSDDETNWTTVVGSYAEAEADGYTNLKATYTFNAAVSARFIKITLYSTAYVLALGEIEVWGGASGSDTPSTDSFALAMTASDAQYNGADCVAVDIVVNNITKALLGVEFNIAFDASVMTPVLASDGSIVVDVVAGPTTDNLGAVYTAGAGTVNVNMVADVDAYADEAAFYAAAVSANGGIALRVYFTSTVPAGASTTVSVGSASGLWMTATDGGYVTGKGASATYSVAEEVVYYDVTFVAGANGTLSGTTTVSVEAGTDLSTVAFPEATANTGYDFVAWDKTSGAINSDTTVTASFAIKTFTVTFVAGANGTLSGTTTATVNYGTDLSAVAFPTPVANEGYEFDKWDKTSGAITATTTVTASFKAKATEPVVGDFTLTEAAKTAGYSVATGRAAENAANTYLYGCKATTTATVTAADIKALFADSVSIADKNGAALADTATVASGTRIYNAAGDKYIEIVMIGDVRGTGSLATANLTVLKRHMNGGKQLTGALLESADVNFNGTFTISAADLTVMKRVLLGSRTF